MGKNTKAAVVQRERTDKKGEVGVKPAKESKNGKSKPAKVVKEPTPESSEDEDESVDKKMADADDTSESSESSESEAEKKPAVKANGTSKKVTPVVNGSAKAVVNGDESEEESEDDDDEEEEEESEDDESEPEGTSAPSVKPSLIEGALKKAQTEESESESESDEEPEPKAASSKQSKGDESEDSSEEDDESDSEDDEEEKSKPDGPVDAGALHGALTKISSKEESAKSDSSSAEESGSGSEEDSSEEEEEKKPAPKNKRKAVEDSAPAPKKSKVEAVGKTGNPATTNLFVGNLSWNVDDAWLVREFEKYGELKNAFVKVDRETNKHKGFGFVEFVDLDAAISAHDAMNDPDATIDGRTPNCDYGKAQDRRQSGGPKERAQAYGDQLSEPSNVVFVGNTSFTSTQESIGQAFEQFGQIQSVRLPTDRETGEMKGFAFVEYGSIEEATAAIQGMKGQYVDGRPIRLDFTTPRAGGERRGGFGGGDRRGGFGGGDRGNRGGRGGRGDRGGPRGGRGGFRGGPPKTEFKGNKITF